MDVLTVVRVHSKAEMVLLPVEESEAMPPTQVEQTAQAEAEALMVPMEVQLVVALVTMAILAVLEVQVR